MFLYISFFMSIELSLFDCCLYSHTTLNKDKLFIHLISPNVIQGTIVMEIEFSVH